LKANVRTGETLIQAIKNEILAREFYLAAAGKVKNPLIRRRFLNLAEDELEHRTTLSRLFWAQTGAEVGDLEFGTGEFELPDLDSMTMIEVIEFAMAREKEAVENYSKMMEEEQNTRSRGFLEHLVDFEQGHYDMLASELARIMENPGWVDEEV